MRLGHYGVCYSYGGEGRCSRISLPCRFGQGVVAPTWYRPVSELGNVGIFGGRCEPEDGGGLLTTWCREMRGELEIMLDPAHRVLTLWHL